MFVEPCNVLSVYMHCHTHMQVMHKHGHLNTIQEWNLVLSALSRTGNIGALVTTYKDMQECEHIKSDLNTIHALIDGNLKSLSHRNSKAAAYIVYMARPHQTGSVGKT